jgi:hypothetical protein
MIMGIQADMAVMGRDLYNLPVVAEVDTLTVTNTGELPKVVLVTLVVHMQLDIVAENKSAAEHRVQGLLAE